MDSDSNNNLFYTIGLGLQLGLIIAMPLIGFLILGIFLDKRFNSGFVFLIVSIIISLIVSVLDIRYLILPFLNKKVSDKK